MLNLCIPVLCPGDEPEPKHWMSLVPSDVRQELEPHMKNGDDLVIEKELGQGSEKHRFGGFTQPDIQWQIVKVIG